MELRIPSREYNNLMQFALKPTEFTYLIRAGRAAGFLDYIDVPIVMRGEKNDSPPVVIHKDFKAIRHERKEKNYVLIAGHSHPQPKGERIVPFNCGWTLRRTEELRDYRNTRLQETDEGKRVLYARKEILEQIAQTEPDSQKEELAEKLIYHSLDVATANLISSNDISFFITNRANYYDESQLKKDIYLRDSDLELGFKLKEHFDVELCALIHASPDCVYQPSSIDRYMLSVIRINQPELDKVEKIDVKVV